MKYWKHITVFTLFSFFAQGQSITYKVIKDTPDDIANYWVNVGLLDVGFGADNNGFGFLGSSLGGVVHYKNKFGGELFYKNNWLSLNKTTKSGWQFELGGFYHLGSKSKTKNQKVVLTDKSNGPSMKVPATIQRSFGLRAGLNMVHEGLGATVKAHEVASDMDLVVNTVGIYAGVLMTSAVNVKSHTQEYGIKSSGFVRRNYLDVLINPVNKITNPDGTDFTGNIKKGIIGFRLGVQFLQPEPKKITGTAAYHKLEIGSRPIDGYYATYTIGFNFKRKVKSMSSFKVIREKE
ncbi:MAG: hypothetical protein ACO1O6_05245 [Bacteroidota bacterium]